MQLKLKLSKQKYVFIYIYIFLLIITLPFIFRDFTPRDELKYIDIANTMIKNKKIFSLYFYNELYTDKPPLYFWIIVLSKFIFGGFYTYSIVLFNILIESFLLTKTYKFLSKKINNNEFLFLIFLMASSILNYLCLIVIRMDIYLAAFISLALIHFFECYEKQKYKNIYMSYIYIGLGFLFKGLVGILTPILVIFIFKFVSKKKYTFKDIKIIQGLLIIIAFILFWLIPAYISEGKIFINSLFYKQVYARTVNASIHKEAFYYYILMIPLITFPWNGLTTFSIYKSIKNKQKTDLDTFLLLWIWITVFYLSIVSSKLVIYLLPIVYPILIITIIEYKKMNDSIKRKLLIFNILQLSLIFIVLFFIKLKEFESLKYNLLISFFILITICLFFIYKNKINRSFYISGSLIFIISIISFFNYQMINENIGLYRYVEILREQEISNDKKIYTTDQDLLRAQFMLNKSIEAINEEDIFNKQINDLIFIKTKNIDKVTVKYKIIYKDKKYHIIRLEKNEI